MINKKKKLLLLLQVPSDLIGYIFSFLNWSFQSILAKQTDFLFYLTKNLNIPLYILRNNKLEYVNHIYIHSMSSSSSLLYNFAKNITFNCLCNFDEYIKPCKDNTKNNPPNVNINFTFKNLITIQTKVNTLKLHGIPVDLSKISYQCTKLTISHCKLVITKNIITFLKKLEFVEVKNCLCLLKRIQCKTLEVLIIRFPKETKEQRRRREAEESNNTYVFDSFPRLQTVKFVRVPNKIQIPNKLKSAYLINSVKCIEGGGINPYHTLFIEFLDKLTCLEFIHIRNLLKCQNVVLVNVNNSKDIQQIIINETINDVKIRNLLKYQNVKNETINDVKKY